MAATKKYGLILSKKSKVSSIKKPSVFEDSSSDEEVRVLAKATVRSHWSLFVQVDGPRVKGKIPSSALWRENKKNAMKTEVLTDVCGSDLMGIVDYL